MSRAGWAGLGGWTGLDGLGGWVVVVYMGGGRWDRYISRHAMGAV